MKEKVTKKQKENVVTLWFLFSAEKNLNQQEMMTENNEQKQK